MTNSPWAPGHHRHRAGGLLRAGIVQSWVRERLGTHGSHFTSKLPAQMVGFTINYGFTWFNYPEMGIDIAWYSRVDCNPSSPISGKWGGHDWLYIILPPYLLTSPHVYNPAIGGWTCFDHPAIYIYIHREHLPIHEFKLVRCPMISQHTKHHQYSQFPIFKPDKTIGGCDSRCILEMPGCCWRPGTAVCIQYFMVEVVRLPGWKGWTLGFWLITSHIGDFSSKDRYFTSTRCFFGQQQWRICQRTWGFDPHRMWTRM